MALRNNDILQPANIHNFKIKLWIQLFFRIHEMTRKEETEDMLLSMRNAAETESFRKKCSIVIYNTKKASQMRKIL